MEIRRSVIGMLAVAAIGCGNSSAVSDAYPRTAAFGHGTLVAVGDGGEIATSTDGSACTRQPSGVNVDLLGVTYGLVVGNGGRVLASSDGTAWIATTVSSDVSFLGVAYGDGTFVIVGFSGTIVNSDDGISWISL